MKKWIEQLKNKFAKKNTSVELDDDESFDSEELLDEEVPTQLDNSPTFLEKVKTKFKQLTAKKDHGVSESAEDLSDDEPAEELSEHEVTESEDEHDIEDIETPSELKPSFMTRMKEGLDPQNVKSRINDLVNKIKNKKNAPKLDSLSVGNQFKNKSESIDWLKLPETLFSEGFRSNIHRAFLVTTVAALSYGTGKTVAMFSKTKDKYVPRTANARAPITANTLTMSDLKKIGRTNVFRTDTKKKDLKGGTKKTINRTTKCIAATRKTKLPLTLINTVVLQDKVKSIASVQIRSKREPKSFRVGETIGKYAKIDKITRLELILKNLKDGSCELLTSKELVKKKKTPITVLSPKASKSFRKKKTVKGISNAGNNFKISRKFLQSKMKDISSILTQARAIRLTNPDGSMAFKITEIVPDSVFSNLGIENGDIISSINGKKITDMNQVMGLFGKINTVDNLSMDVQRDGRKVPLDYSFTE